VISISTDLLWPSCKATAMWTKLLRDQYSPIHVPPRHPLSSACGAWCNRSVNRSDSSTVYTAQIHTAYLSSSPRPVHDHMNETREHLVIRRMRHGYESMMGNHI
jgi:hypothetical protein